jgi:hypothetical protein
MHVIVMWTVPRHLTIVRMESDGVSERAVEARLIGFDEMRRLRSQPLKNGLQRESP